MAPLFSPPRPTDRLTMQQQDAVRRELHFWPIFLTHSSAGRQAGRPLWRRIIEQLQAATQRTGKPNPSCVVSGEENARFSRKIGNSYSALSFLQILFGLKRVLLPAISKNVLRLGILYSPFLGSEETKSRFGAAAANFKCRNSAGGKMPRWRRTIRARASERAACSSKALKQNLNNAFVLNGGVAFPPSKMNQQNAELQYF